MRHLLRAATILSVTAALSCSDSTSSSETGRDASSGDSAAPDLGVATGGVPGTGGAVGTGGGSGGAIATGGASGLGGTSAAGGVKATGGSPATGGTPNKDGGLGTGGAVGLDGGSGTGGVVGKDGGLGTGGAAGKDGGLGTGGAVGIDGGTGTGGVAGTPKGWLYTNGGKIYVSDGNGSGTEWMGRGVNVDDIFLCEYNYQLWMSSPDQTLKTIIASLLSGWKPNFLRMSLSMATDPVVTSWLSNPAQYKTPMTNVINAVGTYPNVYLLVSLRSDASMIGQDTVDGDPEATGLPSDSSTTPNATKFPTGTDATYIALVDSFANSSFVLFGLTNEPGGNKLSNATIAAAMNHAVGVIRAEEDRLGVPHHIVSVQGNGWTSDISFYAVTPSPIKYDNVVYEIHGYPPTATEYTHPTIPVIIGEYGSLTSTTAATFYADVEAKKISNLAWDFDPFSDCAPDLLSVNQSATNLVPSAWGSIVQAYLLAHAP
jgi:hypothetical protein